jgi:5'-3' exonuclease
MKTYIQNVLFKELGVETALGFKVVAVEGCESDDIIAVIMRKYTDYPCRILFSSDKDFLQLKNVFQYNCWGKRVVRTIPDVVEEEVSRKDFLLWKIIRGDLSDNIKNVFPKYGDKKSWKLVQDRPRLRRLLAEDNGAMERYKLNRSLIDFGRIPEDCVQRIKEALDEKLRDAALADEFMLEGAMVL